MRSFDVYCAFCSSSLNGVAIGTETKKDCELQRLFIEERIEKLEARRRSGVNCPSISVNPLKHNTSASDVGIVLPDEPTRDASGRCKITQ
ncbi:hypothetical protein ACO22_07077, partial [Paracoccidioides brasiliensis]